MGDVLRDWIFGLSAAAVMASCAHLLSPKGGVEKVTGFVCSLMLTTALVSPLMKLDVSASNWSMESYRQNVADLARDLESQQNRWLRTYIEKQCAAYILDEAQVLGVTDGTAEVSATWDNGNWIPYTVSLKMTVTPEQKQKLSSWVVTQLGISEERLRWSGG